MNTKYRFAAVVGGLGLAAVVGGLLSDEGLPLGVLLAAAAAPIAVAAMVWGRLGEGRFPAPAAIGGAIVGPLAAIAGYAAVAAFAFAFVLGLADLGRDLLDALRVDPRIVTVLGSPWVIVLLISVAVVAPITEEVGKAVAARFARPSSRREAFFAGVAAGTGFAVVENLVYVSLAASFGEPWRGVALIRSLGAAVHPLASGLVMLGWWEWRERGSLRRLLKGFLAGFGLHALWNASLVVVGVVETATSFGGADVALGPLSLAYAAALGAALAGVLWVLTVSVAEGRQSLAYDFRDGRAVAAWIVLAASVTAPVAALVLAFPDFYLR